MIGTDIVEVSRIQNSIESLGAQFLDRTFTKAEQDYCEKYALKYERYAGRFAAKEAVAKVIRKGPKDFWLDIEILNNEDGVPVVRLSERLKAVFLHDIEVSISHEKNYASATAIITSLNPSGDVIYDDYTKRDGFWDGIYSENVRLIDENLVLLSSGAIVFTVSIVQILEPYYNFNWLVSIWGIFSFSLILRLLSFVTGEKTAEAKKRINKKNYQDFVDKIKKKYEYDKPDDTRFQVCTRWFNRVSFWLFIVGVILFFGYAFKAGYSKDQKIKNSEKRSLNMSDKIFTGGNSGGDAPISRGTRGNPGGEAPAQRPTASGSNSGSNSQTPTSTTPSTTK